MIVLSLRKNRCPEVRQVMLHHLQHKLDELPGICSCAGQVLSPEDLIRLLRLVFGISPPPKIHTNLRKFGIVLLIIRKLPVDQEYAIRQSFAFFLLFTPLFFPEFLASNDKGMAARAYIGGKGPCRPWGGRQAPVARWGGDRPLFFWPGTSLQI